MSDIEAEIGKLAHNAYIATKVTFTCEIERIADSMGCDAMKVMRTVWTDRRVNNSAHLTPYKGDSEESVFLRIQPHFVVLMKIQNH